LNIGRRKHLGPRAAAGRTGVAICRGRAESRENRMMAALNA
jgi:hypothetical protein